MSEQTYNPNDPLFLASRSLDETLCEPDRRRLDDWLAGSESAAQELARLGAVDRLVHQWGQAKVVEGQTNLAKSVLDRISQDAQCEPADSVDGLLEQWGRSQPEIDWNQFSSAVMTKVRAERRRRIVTRLTFRLGAPLAAAALVFALTLDFRAPLGTPTAKPLGVVNIAWKSPAARQAVTQTATLVSFARISGGEKPVDRLTPAITVAWAGSAPMAGELPEDGGPAF